MSETKVQAYDLEADCGQYCQGGYPRLDPTNYPDEYSVIITGLIVIWRAA